MSCSEKTPLSQLRCRVDDFLATPYYIITVMVLSVAAHIFSLELPVYTLLVLVSVYTAIFGRDLLPVTPLFLFCYIIPATGNNPGRNEQSVFSGGTGLYVAVLGVVLAAAMVWYILRNRQQFFSKKRKLLPGLLLLAAAYMLSGAGSPGYREVASGNLLFAAMQAGSVLVPYCLFSGGIDWKHTRRDYLAWIGFTAGGALLVQVLFSYLTQNVIVNGVIIRDRIYTGWGMYNNMGCMLAMSIPFAFYLATKYRRGWIGTVVGSVFWIGLLMTCSRTSLVVGTLTYCFCVFLMLRYARNRKYNMVALITVAAVFVLVIVLFRTQLLRLFSAFLSMGTDPSSRDVFFREGWQLFLKTPIFGASFYSPGYVPWDFSQVESLSALIPPRWHNTYLQLLVSCGTVGVAAYGFHRYQTIRLLVRKPSKEKTFIGCAMGVILLCSLFDCHFFNLGPAIFYSAALAFGENLEEN